MVERYRQLGVILSNTISATGLRSGVKHNVIPAVAEATLDCRLVPGYEQERFLTELGRVIDDSAVHVETVFGSESPATTLDPKMSSTFSEICQDVMPEAAILPRVSPGFTDSRVFRRRGIPAVGFVPMLLSQSEMGGQHGNNERVSIKNLRLAIEVLYRLAEKLCTE